MTIQVDNALPPNVVEIGNEITQGVVDGLMSASPSASSVNPYVTQSLLDGKLSLSGGTMTGDIGLNFNDLNQVTSVVFADNSVQTTAAVAPTFATTAQAQAGTSTTTVVSPATLLDAKYFQGGRNISQVTWVAGGSGSGATSSFVQNRRDVSAPTTVVGAGWWYAFLSNASRGSSVTSSFNWAKRVVFGARLNRNVASPDANTIFRFSIGKTTQAQGDLIERGIMVKQTAGGALQLLVHNGSTLSTVTSSFTPTYQQAYDLLVVSDGAGNATLYVNDVSVATSTGSPTTAGGINSHQLIYMAENSAVITGSPMNYQISDVFFQNNL